MNRGCRGKNTIADAFLVLLVISLCMIWYTRRCTDIQYTIGEKYGQNIQARQNHSQKKNEDKVFVLDAFLVSESEIRITTIRKCKSKKRLTLHLDYNSSSTSFDTQDFPIVGCPWGFAPKCYLVGYISAVKPIKLDFLNQATIPVNASIRISSNSSSVSLRLIEARIKDNDFSYKLAVCVQPIFLLADWTVLIHFFETWIYLGAKKFYVYFQSATPEVNELLRLYEKSANVSVERVQWALLPDDENYGAIDQPNDNVYRGEVLTSVNDCLMRARAEAKYVVSSDLDEMIVTYKKELLPFIDDFLKAKPKTAALVFLQQYVAFQNYWANVTDPSLINFNILTNVSVERKVWPKGKRSKVVWIPEVVFKSHVHEVLNIRKGYKVAVVDSKEGAVYHFRRIQSPASHMENADVSDYFAKYIPLYNAQWHHRLAEINSSSDYQILKREAWPNRGLKVMEEIDKCRDAMERKKKQICTSYTRCFNNITSVKKEEWIYAEQKWGVL